MTRLAPDIVRSIVDGRQPRHVNLHAMRGQQEDVPLDWDEQRGMSGFESTRGRWGERRLYRAATALLRAPAMRQNDSVVNTRFLATRSHEFWSQSAAVREIRLAEFASVYDSGSASSKSFC